ncbi:hypothetical protein [Pararcticibacter amylolyticus]|uniref:Uncharacterized protein n=1 Tax=Pararcticibacter amylolyticus TaxID=2173175 RepID=A0A2U2PCA4_9SPHI|nr:hypothetical protein [Pararcticibacter amylolyticus]PWG79031.1 hypothetical protein DDR33_19530 [Pararcticibacter amylolyticus]
MGHTFHIPVLGLGFTIDTPLKVARYGISSVLSIVDDMLIERIRKFHTEKEGEVFVPIGPGEPDSRARRITAYLNFVNRKVNQQFDELRLQPFEEGSDITRYFDLLPDSSSLKQRYMVMLSVNDPGLKKKMEAELRGDMEKGAVDVNIMSKVDKMNYTAKGDVLGEEFSDALAGLRGFANSDLNSSVILSAGMNPRLYSYLENFKDFYPDEKGRLRKRIVLKVSDFRSAFIQAKFLAKKGLWVSEFRIESGLNCGGHAFATDGYLLGPILEEFKSKRPEMIADVFSLYQSALAAKELVVDEAPKMRITVQGGIGTAEEQNFLMNYYELDSTGWGSPFLLVPEATNVDDETLESLIHSDSSDFYISGSSPLGIPFNNYRKSTAELQRIERIEKGRPGSPCKKKFLVSNTEFTQEPICTASREYQNLKLKQLDELNLPADEYKVRFDTITEKLCLCEGLCTSAYIKNDILERKESKAVAICPGPNLAYFSRVFSLDEMVKHIYGKLNLLQGVSRPSVFVNELKLYLDYLKKDITVHIKNLDAKKLKQLEKFKEQLLIGIEYYKKLISHINNHTEQYLKKLLDDLLEIEAQIKQIVIGTFAEA